LNTFLAGREQGYSVQILQTSYEFPPLGGGGAKVVAGISRRLAARGHVVDVLTMGFRRLPATEVAAGVNIKRVPGIRTRVSSCSAVEMIPYVLLAPFFVRRKRAERYIINHTHFIFPGGIIAYALKRLVGLPYVITAHGSDVPNFNPNRFRVLHRILLPIWRKIAVDASLVICPSRSIENLIKASYSQVRTRVIPNAIDIDKFHPGDKDPRRVLVVTRMFERKGVQYVLQALEGFAGRFAVDIVGDGPYLATLKALAQQLKVEVRFWGHMDNDSAELKNLYESAAIFVFTSEAENFPIVLLEAMIAGAAVITTMGTGCEEVVADSALLVPVRDAMAIREALDRLSKDPDLVARLGRAARDRVVSNFGWDGVIDQHMRVYEEFGRRPRRAQRLATQSLRILCPTYWYPGSADDTQAVYVHDINRHLVLRGHKVCVVTPGKPGLAERETFDGVEVVRFPFELPEDLTYGRVAQSKVSNFGKLKRVVTMARYMAAQYRHTVIEGRRFGAQIVHGHWAIPTGPALVAGAMRLGLPSVITLHGGDVYVNVTEGYDFPTRWYIRPILAWTLRKASALTAISEDCKMHALKAGAHESNLWVVMNGADLRRFSPAQPSELLHESSFGPDMLFACRQLFPRKGIRVLIEATAKLVAKYPSIKLIIAGDGFERPALENLSRQLGIADRTTFLGWVPNKALPPYYRGCAVSVIPSLEEGFGIPAAEAMGCEVPVVATDAGGLPEVVADGVTGLIVPKGNVDALAAAMDRLLADPQLRVQMGKAGRKRALEKFDWDRSVEQFDAAYRVVLNQGKS
jgi:glycosyltransferase involved in cell wall biosynthesis